VMNLPQANAALGRQVPSFDAFEYRSKQKCGWRLPGPWPAATRGWPRSMGTGRMGRMRSRGSLSALKLAPTTCRGRASSAVVFRKIGGVRERATLRPQSNPIQAEPQRLRPFDSLAYWLATPRSRSLAMFKASLAVRLMISSRVPSQP